MSVLRSGQQETQYGAKATIARGKVRNSQTANYVQCKFSVSGSATSL